MRASRKLPEQGLSKGNGASSFIDQPATASVSVAVWGRAEKAGFCDCEQENPL
jgi:hypothetical protein